MSVQTKELNNGRLAMIAIAAFVVQVGTQHFSSLLQLQILDPVLPLQPYAH